LARRLIAPIGSCVPGAYRHFCQAACPVIPVAWPICSQVRPA